MKLMSYSIAALALLTGAAHADTLALNPGEWFFVQEGAMTMMGNTMPMPQENNRECITEEDAAFDVSEFSQDECTLTPVSESSSHMEFAMSCSAPEITMTGTLEIELGDGGNSVSVSSHMTGQSPVAGGEMNIVVSVEGERIGECS